MIAMKNSGIEWIDQIPNNWTVNRIKNMFNAGKGLSITKADLIDQGLPVVSYGQIHSKLNNGTDIKASLLRFVDYSYKKYYPQCKVNNSDFVFADTSEDYDGIGNCVYKRDDSLLYAGYHAIVLKSKVPTDNRYLAYLFQTDAWRKQLRESASGVKVFSVSQRALLNASIILPTNDEMISIANYLDEKCAEIDALSADVQAEIETLEAYKQSVIAEAVTKGLDKNVAMKDSGIEWIGQIPSTWEVLNIKRIYDHKNYYPIGDGDHGLIKPADYLEEGIPYIRVQNLGFCTELKLDNVVYISPEKNKRIASSTLKPKDVLFAKTGATIGKTGIIPDDMKMANTTSHVGKITVAPQFNPRYVYYVLSSYIGYKQFWDIASLKSTRPELSLEEIKRMFITIPKSRDVQDKIVKYLDEKCVEIDCCVSQKQEQLTILTDYKKSLIYEYVTGKKEVTEI